MLRDNVKSHFLPWHLTDLQLGSQCIAHLPSAGSIPTVIMKLQSATVSLNKLNHKNLGIQTKRVPGEEQAQSLGPFLTGSRDTGKDPLTPLMDTSYTWII